MTLARSFPTQNPTGLPITDTRRVTAGLIARNADGTPRPGVFPTSTALLVTGRATAPLMAYDVAPFLAATSRLNTGVELIANDASTTVATTAAPGSNSRIDVIWVRSQFVQHADANNDVVFGVTQGVAALTPTKPAIPAGALELAIAEILSTTTQTSTAVITQTHPYTAAAGAPVLMRNRTELDAWSAPAGAIARTLDTDLEWVRRPAPSSGPLTWYLTPGQRLAYMSAAVTNGNANTIIGTVAKTIPLPIGQRVKIRCKPVSMYVAAAAGIVYYSIRAHNAAADVSPSLSTKTTISRGMHPGTSNVTSVAGTEMELVTTQAQPVTAALFNEFGVTYNTDGQELWIESY